MNRIGPIPGFRIRAGTTEDREAVAAFLAGLSASSSYLRFQTGLGPVPPRRLVDALLPTGPGGGALLGYVGDRLVAHGMWVRARAASVAEIGIVVADDHQSRGIGTALATALVDELIARGIERVEVFTGATNQAVTRMLAVNAPGAVRVLDGVTVTYTFPARSAETPTRRTA